MGYEKAAEISEKKKRIEAEEKRLRRQFTQIDRKKKEVVQSLIEDAAYCRIEMQDLREKLHVVGVVSEYKNGENQFGTKQSPEIQVYNQLSSRSAAAMKILVDCLPKTGKPPPQDDGFDDFVKRRDGL